jgi:hypothetical protein
MSWTMDRIGVYFEVDVTTIFWFWGFFFDTFLKVKDMG